MLDGKVNITVTGRGDLSDNNSVVHTSVGNLYTKNGGRYLIYDMEDENNPNISLHYTIKIKGNTLTVTKSNLAGRSTITYEPGKCTLSNYETPYGVLDLTFKTLDFSVEESPSKLTIKLEYFILMGEEEVSHNYLEINASL